VLYRIGIAPFLVLSMSIIRTDVGAHLTFSIYLYKLGLHFGATAID
jgi:hypothetical protein